MAAKSVINLNKVSKKYEMGEEEFYALKDVSLKINKGEFVAIIGPSGSGKSTLMHIIGLLDKPTSGEVFLEEKEVHNLSEIYQAELRNKHIGFIFQVFNLLPRTSALENVEMPLIYSGIGKKEREERAIKALEVVGLGEKLQNKPSQLSGGQQQRVAIARALINNPSLILADEPTGNLDSKSGEEILSLLDRLNKEGNTIVVVTHDADIAKRARRIVTLKDGEIVSDKK
ncbi:MAG: ABC transporter ATP-binding protein [Candidatus Woesebacteria bacterium]|nr:ABC transporter ATP-binding protein [Candidatus Woesebacteria bacterium]